MAVNINSSIEECEGKKEQEIKNGYEYIEWLEKYTKENPSFTNGSITNVKDKENVDNLETFYYTINNFAKKNYIYPTETTCGNFYIIKYEENHYKVGYIDNEETIFYCQSINEVEDENIVDFTDVLNNKISPTAELIKLKMMKLSLILSELELVMPEEKLHEEVEKMYRKNKWQ